MLPTIRAVLDAIDASPRPPAETLTDEQAALDYVTAMRSAMVAREPTIAVAHVEDRTLCNRFGIRIYRNRQDQPLPAVVYFHGGGWATGDLDYQDAVCRRLALDGDCVVVNVSYRLAPEHRFPAAMDDAYDATAWVFEHAGEIGADPARIAIMGSSSGANLAAAVALRRRDTGDPSLTLQVLVYPPLDSEMASRSYGENAHGYMLSAELMAWFWHQYVHRKQDRTNPWASPRHATDLAGLPPAIVETAELDPLRDEAEEYAARLRDAGVPVTLSRHDGLIHGYLGFTEAVPEADAAVGSLIRRIRDRLHAAAPADRGKVVPGLR